MDTYPVGAVRLKVEPCAGGRQRGGNLERLVTSPTGEHRFPATGRTLLRSHERLSRSHRPGARCCRDSRSGMGTAGAVINAG